MKYHGPFNNTPLVPMEYHSLSAFLLSAFLRDIPSFYRSLLHHHTQKASDLKVRRAFQSSSQVEIVSDGSLLATNIGTFGWRIIRPPALTLSEGSGPVGGPIELGTLTRSELGGCAAPLLLVAALSKFWGLSHRCKFYWVVDSSSAISKVKTVTRPGASPNKQPNNIDFLTLITDLYQDIRHPTSITWVKGHQYSIKPIGQLP